MKTKFLFILFAFYFHSGCSQIFPIDTLVLNGDTDKRINLVFLGDGYMESELDKYIQDVNAIVEDLFLTTPLQEYQNYFNVFAIKVPSNESGAKHPGTANDESGSQPVEDVDNYFGSTFDFFDIHRLVVPEESFKINSVLANNFPTYDQVFILVNSPYYGGSGGASATSTIHSSASEIAIHEIGHSFTSLADEYYAGDVYAGERANMTQETNPALVKWKNWHGEEGIGIYQHCCSGMSAEWYRPHQNCKMQSLGVPFCAVCTEIFVERIHNLVSPLESFEPMNFDLTNSGENIQFKLNLIHPEPSTLSIDWILNGNEFTSGPDSLLLPSDQLVTSSMNTLEATVIDNTQFSRADAHQDLHFYSVQWLIDKTSTTIHTIGKELSLDLSIYPNPVSDQLQIGYELDQSAKMGFNLLDVHGQVLQSIPATDQGQGKHQQEFNLEDYSAGTYFIQIKFNGAVIKRPIVKVK